MKTIADVASPAEQDIITKHYGLPKSVLTETPASVNEERHGETVFAMKNGTLVIIYDAVEPVVEMPATLGNYVIRVTRYFYGPKVKRSLKQVDGGTQAVRFQTKSEAQAFIAQLEHRVYHLGHNESGRCKYDALHLSKLPRYLKWEL